MPKLLSPRLLSIATSMTCALGSAGALESFAVGPRALGMGGTGVACVNDVQAQYYNPAAFGFFKYGGTDDTQVAVDNQNLYEKDWGLGIDVGVGARIHEQFAEYADNLKRIYDGGVVQRIQSGTAITTADVKDFTIFSDALTHLADPGEALSVDMNAGFGLRIGHFCLGARALSQMSAKVYSIDWAFSGGSGAQIEAALDAANTAAAPPGGYSIHVLTAGQQASLTTLGLSTTSITQLDYLANQAGVTSAEIQSTVDLMTEVNTALGGTTGGSSITANTTSARLYGVAIGEVPLTYGYAINDYVSVGGSLKLMLGRVYGSDVLIFDNDASEILSDAKEHYESTTTWGVDLGIMARMNMLQGGLNVRNLNAPKFHGPTVQNLLSSGATRTVTYDDYTASPSVSTGIAFIPWHNFTLAADMDITSNKTTLNDYKTRNLGLGTELNLWVVAFRAGLMKNLAESDIGMIYTAGFGLNVWAFRIDAAAAMAKEKTTFDGKEYPKELRGSLQIAVDF